MRSLLKYQHSFFIVQKIYTRLEDEGDRERMLKMLSDNLPYAKENLIRSKIQALINKGPCISANNSSSSGAQP
jgi:hypothetical protein